MFYNFNTGDKTSVIVISSISSSVLMSLSTSNDN